MAASRGGPGSRIASRTINVEKDRPGVIAPPPLIFAVAFAIGYVLRNLLPHAGSSIGGIAFAVAGLLIGGFAFAAMLRARTHIDPYKPATALVTTGPFRFSRNPLYLSVTLLYIGAALSFRILPALLLLPIALMVMHFGVIRREERYLERKFGDEYRAFRARVRRWV